MSHGPSPPPPEEPSGAGPQLTLFHRISPGGGGAASASRYLVMNEMAGVWANVVDVPRHALIDLEACAYSLYELE